MLKKRLCFYHDQSISAVHPAIRLYSVFDFDKDPCHCLCAMCELKKHTSWDTFNKCFSCEEKNEVKYLGEICTYFFIEVLYKIKK